MRIGWRTITAIKRFLCERQNTLAKKKTDLKDIAFGIKRGRFGDLLNQINENVCRDNPMSPDSLEDILAIFLKDEAITSYEADRNKYLVSEAGYQAMGIAMERSGEEKPQFIKEDSVQEKPVEQKFVEEESKPSAPEEKKSRKETITPITIHENIECRACLMVDGYTEQEKNCRHCGAKLFKGA